jgi:hypothetical protein
MLDASNEPEKRVLRRSSLFFMRTPVENLTPSHPVDEEGPTIDPLAAQGSLTLTEDHASLLAVNVGTQPLLPSDLED